MKQLLITIAAVVLVGCGESQQSAPSPETPTEADRALLEAAFDEDIKAVKQHLADGADVNAKDKFYGGTSLHHAAKAGQKEIIELLIANGADVNVKIEDDLGATPLHFVAIAGHNEIAELLIVNGADVNAKDNFGNTPLEFAIRTDHPETADLLRKHGGKTAEELEAEGK